MKSPALVSVVIPSFNHSRFIYEAIRSVFSQTHPRLELIVVDDGSSDGSVAVIKEALRTLSGTRPLPVRIFTQKNRGAHAALNRGIAACRGKYVSILNSDDFYHPERIARLLGKAQASGAPLVFSLAELVDPEGRKLNGSARIPFWYYTAVSQRHYVPTTGFSLLQANWALSTSGFLFEKRHFEKIGPFRPYRYVHDIDFLLRSLRVAEPAVVTEPLFSYRVHDGNTIQSDFRFYAESKDVLNDYFGSLLEQTPANPLAPCSAHWPATFVPFLRAQRAFFSARTLIDELNPIDLVPVDTSGHTSERQLALSARLQTEFGLTPEALLERLQEAPALLGTKESHLVRSPTAIAPFRTRAFAQPLYLQMAPGAFPTQVGKITTIELRSRAPHELAFRRAALIREGKIVAVGKYAGLLGKRAIYRVFMPAAAPSAPKYEDEHESGRWTLIEDTPTGYIDLSPPLRQQAPAKSETAPAATLTLGKRPRLRVHGHSYRVVSPDRHEGHLDSWQTLADRIELRGWSADFARSQLPEQWVLAIGDRVLPVHPYLSARTDLRQLAGGQPELVEKAGFRLEVPRSLLLPGAPAQSLRLFCAFPDGTVSDLTEGKLIVASNGRIFKMPHAPSIHPLKLTAGVFRGKAGGKTRHWKTRTPPGSVFEPRSLWGLLEPSREALEGWAFHPRLKTAPEVLVLARKDRVVSLHLPERLREDLQILHGLKAKPRAGFRVPLPARAPAKGLALYALWPNGDAIELRSAEEILNSRQARQTRGALQTRIK